MNPLAWLQDPLIRESLGWTAVHFLWLGSVLWLLAIAGRSALRQASATVRYGYSVGSLMALTILPFVVFGIVQGSTLQESMKLPPPSRIDYLAGMTGPTGTAASGSATAQEFPSLIKQQDSESLQMGRKIVLLLPFGWLAGSLICSVALMFGAIGVERLRRGVVHELDDELVQQFAELKGRLAIAGDVLLGYSDRLVSPVIIGLFRPMILLPVSAMSGVSREQLEMILLHELAHVRRRDNWVNLGQRVIEAVLFFHPAVWSVSAWIREEREYCCDDTVMRNTAHEREAYARTLAELAFQSPQQGQLLTSAMAHKPLLSRIRNILDQKDQNMKTTHKSIIPAVVCFAAFNLLAYSTALSFAETKTEAKTGRSGDGVLTKVLKKYAALESYEASGSTSMEMSAMKVAEDASEREKAMARKTNMRSDFSILLDRSKKLRLEWAQNVHPSFTQGGVASSDGKEHVYQPSFGTKPNKYQSAKMLLGAVQGVSSMLPETARLFNGTASVLTPLKETLITGEAVLDGASCWVITGKNSIGQDVTLWVTKNEDLIRRYRIVLRPGAIKVPKGAEAAHEKLFKKHPKARAAAEMALKRTITWQADFREITTNARIDQSRFAAASSD